MEAMRARNCERKQVRVVCAGSYKGNPKTTGKETAAGSPEEEREFETR
jgi:hypothetical protein